MNWQNWCGIGQQFCNPPGSVDFRLVGPCNGTAKGEAWKGQGNDQCCDHFEHGPCGEGEGDCDSDQECSGSLVCGRDNCPWGDGDDCCQKPAVDCQWGSWGQWGQCSVTCGGGTRDRARVKTQQAANGGAACQGSSDESTNCSQNACPGRLDESK